MKNMIPCHLKIAGMYCTQCEKRIQKALQNLDGVQNVQVNYQKANAKFEYDDKIISYENIVKAIKDEGYTIVKENRHSQGGVLSGIMSVGILSANPEKNKAIYLDGVQIVESELTAGSYPEITVQSGVPVRWNIHAKEKSVNGCNNTIICNALDLQYEFHEGDNIIEFTPTQTGDIDYSCWMGMIYGKIHVIN